MNLQEYIYHLKSYIATHPPDLDNEDSILGLLYEAHSESNAMYDEVIKADFHALYQAMNGMPLREMDTIVYPVCALCRSHQKAGFIEGVRIGFLLSSELRNDHKISSQLVTHCHQP